MHQFSNDTHVILFYKFKEVTSDEIDRYHPHIKSMFTPLFFIEFFVLAVCPIPEFDMFITSTVDET